QILVDFNSDNFADSPNPQTVTVCAFTGPFDFTTNTYYLNVRLVRNSPTADPRFYGFKVCDGSGSCVVDAN
ncbi:MAG: hypothetical protein HYX76_04585, partial [Acidobacteria bacterium]|nr:hypothetical protein [Acidobacteriota bacterium]